MTDTDYLLQRLREVRTIRVRGGGGRNAVLPPSEIDLEAATEIERLRAEVANWREKSIENDLRAERHQAELAALREEIARYATSLTVALGHRDEFKRRAEAAESELAALRGSIAEARLGHLTWVGEDDGGWAIVPDDDGAYWDYEGERVRLLIEPMSSDSSPSSAPVPDRSPGSSTR